jgi:polyketide synthase 13
MASLSADQVEDWLVARIAATTHVGAAEIDPEAPFTSLQLSSIDVLDLAVDLEDLLGIEIDSTIAYDYPTVRLLSGYAATLAAT